MSNDNHVINKKIDLISIDINPSIKLFDWVFKADDNKNYH